MTRSPLLTNQKTVLENIDQSEDSITSDTTTVVTPSLQTPQLSVEPLPQNAICHFQIVFHTGVLEEQKDVTIDSNILEDINKVCEAYGGQPSTHIIHSPLWHLVKNLTLRFKTIAKVSFKNVMVIHLQRLSSLKCS